jgi:hypothetical protein
MTPNSSSFIPTLRIGQEVRVITDVYEGESTGARGSIGIVHEIDYADPEVPYNVQFKESFWRWFGPEDLEAIVTEREAIHEIIDYDS